MAVAPVRPMQAAPLLGLILQRIRRTPTARLGLVYRLVPSPGCRVNLSLCGCRGRTLRASSRDLRPELCREGNIVERPVAKTLLVERLARGDILGTPLVLGCGESVLVAPADCDERIDVWV